jgi:hypothetical protein
VAIRHLTLFFIFILTVALNAHSAEKNKNKIDCKKFPTCGVISETANKRCPHEKETTCLTISQCKGPVCITDREACSLECGKKSCKIMASYPGQISCDQ